MAERNLEILQKLARDGDKNAERELFENITARFTLFARQRIWEKNDAEEIVQDAVMAVAREYRETVFTTSFSAWAYKVLDYRILSYIRTRQSRREKDNFLKEQSLQNGSASSHSHPEIKIRLMDCLKKLTTANNRYARVLNFHHQGFTVDEICERLKVTRNNLYSILSRARSLLEHCMKTGALE